ncbi:hypothetical protein HMPREF1548_05948 [Clostridium sp. KLE 1755]|nr:hypothetical protein HMPREF1548_05948 [Clostridium sp. KLE 1755]
MSWKNQKHCIFCFIFSSTIPSPAHDFQFPKSPPNSISSRKTAVNSKKQLL